MKLTLSKRVCGALVGIFLLAVISSGVVLLWAWRAEQAFRLMLTRNLEQSRTTYELQIALLEQGLSTSLYLMGGAPEWLSELRRSRPEFQAWLGKIRGMEPVSEEQEFTDRIARAFEGYDVKNRQAVALYREDKPEQAKQLWLDQAVAHYDRVQSLCEGLSAASSQSMEQAIAVRNAEVKRMNLWVVASLSILATLTLGLFLSLSRGLFRPLRHLVDSLGKEQAPVYSRSSVEEIRSLGHYIDGLRGEVAEMRSRLSASQRRLLDAEKLASIGKLAASVAHEIRSPLTSLRLRVFSVQKGMGDSCRRKDFELISEEITRLDNIVGNFLEFARPRDLALQKCDVRRLLDKTIELYAYKLEATNVVVERQDDPAVPDVLADRQQLKQVFMNLLNNAVEALRHGGAVHIATRCEKDAKGVGIVRILVRDNGPGIPREAQESIFDPFFGTKEEGTGLGLWIARRIMTEHGGGIDLEQSTASGTTFSLWLPADKGNGDE